MGKKAFLAFFLSVPLFLLDWVLKGLFEDATCVQDRFIEVCGLLNEGFIFSLPFAWWGWVIVSVIFMLLLVLFLRTLPRPWGASHWAALAFLCAGGVSNTLDRLFYGGVRDYIAAFTGVFNLADIFVLIGITWLVTRALMQHRAAASSSLIS